VDFVVETSEMVVDWVVVAEETVDSVQNVVGAVVVVAVVVAVAAVDVVVIAVAVAFAVEFVVVGLVVGRVEFVVDSDMTVVELKMVGFAVIAATDLGFVVEFAVVVDLAVTVDHLMVVCG
jgi:uncharacterized membrane protein